MVKWYDDGLKSFNRGSNPTFDSFVVISDAVEMLVFSSKTSLLPATIENLEVPGSREI